MKIRRFICLVIVTSSLLSGSTTIGQERDDVDLGKIEKLIDYIMNDTLGVEQMQERISNLEYTKTPFDGLHIVQELAATISDKINVNIEALKRTKKVLEKAMDDHWKKNDYKWPSCCRYNNKKVSFVLDFKSKVDEQHACEVISDSSPRYVNSLPPAVLAVMKENRKKVPSLKWQYVGSEEGVFTLYPAVNKPNMCGGMNFDPRIRPWYVETASPAPKHVVVLLDSSYSMAQTHAGIKLMDIAKKAIEKVMETLNPKDTFGIIAFNDTSYFPQSCYGQSLAVATPVNIATLKSEFLMRLEPGGQSNYAAGFEAAFKLMERSWNHSKEMQKVRPKLKSKFDCIFLFITDGDASEVKRKQVDKIFRAIREGNAKIRNLVTLYAYGLGRKVNLTLLDAIVKQNFTGVLPEVNYTKEERRPQPGYAYHIQDASLLRNNMSFFYHNYRRDNDSKPSFSIPYFDVAGLGLIFTAGFPLYAKGNEKGLLYGVVAVDIALDDLLEDAIKFKKDARSYVFVIDNTGRVLIHPLMPHPSRHTKAPRFIQIDALERDKEFGPVMMSMMKREKGTLTFSSQRIAPAGDCNWVFNVNQTYYWHPIDGTNFSVCFVEEKTDYAAVLTPMIAAVCNNKLHKLDGKEPATFRYHRLDLFDHGDVCRHFYQISTVESSVVKFASSAFKNPIHYATLPETRENVSDYHRFFNKLMKCETLKQANDVVYEEKALAERFQNDAISDVVWTSYVDALWFNKTVLSSHIVRRFIATPSGVIRFYPGTNLTQTYDPTKRFWYELGVTRQGMRAFSPPYKDAAGAGNVITISHTLHAPKQEKKKKQNKPTFADLDENKIIGIMGIDLSLDYLYYELLEMYPKCKHEWKCQLINLRGYVALHEDYINTDSARKQKHITVAHCNASQATRGDDSSLALILLEKGDMFRAACLDLDSNDYKVSYVIKKGTFVNTMSSQNKCQRYYMKEITNTNLFFVAQESHEHCFPYACRVNKRQAFGPHCDHLQARLKHTYSNTSKKITVTTKNLQMPCWQHSICVNKEIIPSVCECPCTAPLVVDTCINYIQASLDIPPCFPDRPKSDVVKTDCLPSSLKPCADPGCSSITNKINCSSVVGCTWCIKTGEGGILPQPYCSDTDVCYNGFANNTLPGFKNVKATCSTELDGTHIMYIIISVVGLFIILFIFGSLVALFHYRGKRNDDSKSEKDSTQYDEVATLSAALGISSNRARKQSLGSMSLRGRNNGNRLASISSQVSMQQKSSSPQVVLSIVDSSGSEIARSQPRPVQIIHGNRPGSAAANIGAPKSPGSRESGFNSGNSNGFSIASGASVVSLRNAIESRHMSSTDLAGMSRSRPCSRSISPLREYSASSKSAPSTPRSLSERRKKRPPSISESVFTALKTMNDSKPAEDEPSPKLSQCPSELSNFETTSSTTNTVDSAYSEESLKAPTIPSPYDNDEQYPDYVSVGINGTITPAGPSGPNSPVHFNYDGYVKGNGINWDSFDKTAEVTSPTYSDNTPNSPKTLFELPQYDDFSLNYIKSNMSALLSDLESPNVLNRRDSGATMGSIDEPLEQTSKSKNDPIKKRTNKQLTNKSSNGDSQLSDDYAKINPTRKKKSKSKTNRKSVDEGFAVYV